MSLQILNHSDLTITTRDQLSSIERLQMKYRVIINV